MAKAKKSGKKKSNVVVVRRARPRASIPRSLTTQLDTYAKNYLRLLADPCNGPLVTAPFGDGQGGIVARFEQDIVLNNDATSVGSYIVFVPSICAYYTSAAAITSDTTLYASGATGAGPGYSQLLSGAGASSFRTIAACLQVYYPGSEQSRSGISAIGQLNQGAVTGTNSTSTIRVLSEYVERTPGAMIELKWTPNNYDMEWGSTTAPDGGSGPLLNRRSALVSSTFGIPVVTGMRYRMVSVIEYLPSSGNGMVAAPTDRTISRNTFSDVLRVLEGAGNWAYTGAMSVGRAASSLYSGFTAVRDVAFGTAKLAALTLG
jgi:hypothetical protein